MKIKILITGSTGFIGSNIINSLLKKDIYIYALLRNKNRKNANLNQLKKNKKYKPIFFKNFNELKKKLKNLKIDTVINCATYYSSKNDIQTIQNLIQTNIIFCSVVLETLSKKIKKFINFGSMMEYSRGNYFSPKNFYAITKYSFQKISEFFKFNNKRIKFYNLKLYETYGNNDNRKKIIPTIVKNYSKNKNIKIVSTNLKMNFIHINSLTKAINMILYKKIEEGEYCLKNNKFTSIKHLIDSLNKKLSKKIKVKYLSSKKYFKSTISLNKFPSWDDKENLKEFLLNQLKK